MICGRKCAMPWTKQTNKSLYLGTFSAREHLSFRRWCRIRDMEIERNTSIGVALTGCC